MPVPRPEDIPAAQVIPLPNFDSSSTESAKNSDADDRKRPRESEESSPEHTLKRAKHMCRSMFLDYSSEELKLTAEMNEFFITFATECPLIPIGTVLHLFHEAKNFEFKELSTNNN